MKLFKKAIFARLGIVILAVVFAMFFTACPQDGDNGGNGNKNPELPAALKNTNWKHTEGHKVQFGAKNTVIVIPASGTEQSFTLKDSQTVTELNRTTLWFGSSQTADFIVYQNNTINSVSLGGVQKTLGWSKDTGGSGTGGDTTYTVTFNINGGNGAPPSVQTIPAGSSITLPSGGWLTKSGFAFNGWNTNDSGTGTNYDAGSSYTPTGSITLYAKWTPIPQLPLTNITDIALFLSVQSSNPVDLSFNLQLTDSNWRNLLAAIDTAGRRVALDLSLCTRSDSNSGGGLRSDGTFNPFSSFSTSFGTGKEKIISLILPNTATTIVPSGDGYGFAGFNELTSVSAQGVTTIGDSAFEGLSSLTSVNFPEATSIGDSAFEDRYYLTNVSFPKVATIGDSAFDNCIRLTTASIPVATSIGDYAFYNCTSLTGASFPVATSIGDSAFSGCTNLITADFSQATSIGWSAFSGCTSLTSISFSAAATNISTDTFRGCTSLVTFTLLGTGSLSAIESGKVLVRNNTELIAYPSASGSIALNTITSIGNYAFDGCTSLTTASFPVATSIGNSAFRGCTSLTTTSFPCATSIGDSAFSGCTSLTSASFPAAISLGKNVFSMTGNTSLTIILGNTAPTLGESLFSGVLFNKSVTVKVPASATGYGTIPASYYYSGSTENWGNGFRGLGWTGTGKISQWTTVNSAISLNVAYLE